MKVTLKIFGFPGLKKTLGGQEVEIEFEGKTARDLITRLIKTHGHEVEKSLMDNNKRLNPSVRLLKNGYQWLTEEDLDTNIMDGDVVVLALLVTGG